MCDTNKESANIWDGPQGSKGWKYDEYDEHVLYKQRIFQDMSEYTLVLMLHHLARVTLYSIDTSANRSESSSRCFREYVTHLVLPRLLA